MSAARGLLAGVALAGLTACPGPGGDCFGGSGQGPLEPPPKLAIVGQQVDVAVDASLPFTCDGTEQFPDALTSEVYAPDNRLVPSTTALRGSSGGAVRFTPDMPGRYHVLAAFAPVGGIRQVGVMAAVDRTAESPAMALPEMCSQVERTTRGTLLCGAAVVRAGQVTQRLGAGASVPWRVAVAGNVVWAVDATTVYRYVDTGEGLLAFSGSVSHGDAPPEFLLATEDELRVLHPTVLQRFVASAAGAVTSTGRSSWSEVGATPYAPDQPRGLLVRSGDVLAVVGRGLVAQGGASAMGTRVCTYHLELGSYVRTKEVACQELQGLPEGIEDGVLWIREQAPASPGSFLPNDTVRRYVLTGGRFEEQGSLPLGPTTFLTSSLFRSTSVPVFSIGQPSPVLVVPVWRPEQRALVLEVLDRDVFSGSASSTFYWGMGPTGPRARARPKG